MDRGESKATSAIRRAYEANPVLLEAGFLSLAATIGITVVATVLASRHLFLGNFGDTEQIIWQAYNVADAAKHGDSILTNSFFGEPTPLTYSRLALFESLAIFALAELTADVYFTYNFLLLGFLFLNFLSMYVVLRLLNRSLSASLLGATVFLCAPVILVHALVHIILIVVFLIPVLFYVLYRIKLEPGNFKYWLVLGLATGGLIWASEDYGIFALLAIASFLLLNIVRLWRERPLRQLALWLFVTALFALPVVAAQLQRIDFDREHNISIARTAEEAQLYSSSPANYFFPSDQNFFYDDLPRLFVHANKVEHLNYLGLINLCALALWLYMFLFRREWYDRFLRRSPFLSTLGPELALIAGIAFVLSLGPLLTLNDSVLKLPVHLVFDLSIPALDQIRAWGRFGIFAFAIATLLSAHLVDYLLNRFGRRLIVAALLPLALVAVFVDQYPVDSIQRHKIEVPAAVAKEIKEANGDFFVMHLPMNIDTCELTSSTAQLFQVFHGKPIVNGCASINPHPLLVEKVNTTLLGCLNYPDMATRAPDECRPDAIAGFLAREDIRYLVYEKTTRYYLPNFTPDDEKLARNRLLQIIGSLEESGTVLKTYDDSSYAVYRRTIDHGP